MPHVNDTLASALALARRGLPVFPCRSDKHPATPGKAGGNGGFHFASTDPAIIRELWREFPGPLIGVRTACRYSVLDVDPGGLPWWRTHRDRIPPTWTYQTRRGGLHVCMLHPPGLLGSKSLIAPQVDVRAERGYAIFWPAQGLPVLDRSPLAPWPQWLLEAATRPEPSPPPVEPFPATSAQTDQFSRYAAWVRKLLANVSAAPKGTKHEVLLRSARALGGIMAQLEWSEDTAVRQLINALPRFGPNAVQDWKNAEATARAGLQHGARSPLVLTDRPYDRRVAT